MRSMALALALFAGGLIIAGLGGPASAQTTAPSSPPSSEASPAPAPAAPTPAPAPATTPVPAPAAAAPATSATTAGPVYIVTYFEVTPAGARKAAALLRQFADATRKADGNTELTVLHEIGRPGRFALVEAWKDKAALDAHASAMKALGDKLRAIFVGPFDARQFAPLAVGAAPAEAPAGAIYVLTHVDVFPQGKDEVAAMIKQLAEDSRKDGGAQRFDAVVWDGHPNHFHLIEAWTDRKVLEAHQAEDHTKTFRAKLVPFEGALYDERLYEVVKKTE